MKVNNLFNFIIEIPLPNFSKRKMYFSDYSKFHWPFISWNVKIHDNTIEILLPMSNFFYLDSFFRCIFRNSTTQKSKFHYPFVFFSFFFEIPLPKNRDSTPQKIEIPLPIVSKFHYPILRAKNTLERSKSMLYIYKKHLLKIIIKITLKLKKRKPSILYPF